MNTRKDKIALLKAIQNGEIDPEDLPSNPVICNRADDLWVGLMINSCRVDEMGRGCVVFIGPARRKLAAFLAELEARHDKKAQVSK
jgi:hypothetical protein